MRNWLSCLLFFVLILASCNNNPSTTKEEPKTSTDNKQQGLPPGFEDFYKKFHNDTSYQLEHVQFPLQGVPGDRSLATDTFTFKKDNWTYHQPFSTTNSVFEQRFQNVGHHIVIEYIFSPRLQVVMERRFQKRGDEWYLIYYKELGDRTSENLVQ